MRVLLLVFSAISFTRLVTAAPVSNTTQPQIEQPSPAAPEGTFTLEEVQNANYLGKDGLESMVAAFLKYNATLTPALQDAVHGHQIISSKYKQLMQRDAMWGTVQAFPPQNFDSEYVVPVKIGTPPQTMNLNLDTGSSDLWVFSSDTPSNQVKTHLLYRPGDSTTSKLQQGELWSIRYGDGTAANGIVYKDTVSIGQTTFENQMVQSATTVSAGLTSDTFSSGILGLGLSESNTIRPTKSLTYTDNIKNSLAAPIFTANLQKGKPGNYNFGYISNFEHNGRIQYAPVYPTSYYWEIPITGYQVGATPYRNEPFTAIADTGTTLLLLPISMVDAYYAQVPEAKFDGGWGAVIFPCVIPLPDFTFGIGVYRGRVPGNYMNYAKVNSTHCYGGMQSSEGIGVNILGAVLLKAQLVVFDMGSPARAKRVGFANKKLVT